MRLFKVWIILLLLLGRTAEAAENPISMKVVDAEIRDVLHSLAVLSGVNILVDDSVKGKVTLNLDRVEFAAALDLLAKTRNLICQREGSSVLVRKAAADGRTAVSFGRIHTFSLQYITPLRAMQAAALSMGMPPDKLSADGRIAVDAGTHTLLFYGNNAEAEEIRQLLKKLDVREQQVSLEAKIVAVSKEAAKKLGVEWEWSKLPQSPEYSTEYETITRTVTDANGNLQTITEQAPRRTVSRTWRDGAESVPGIVGFGRNIDGNPFEFYYAATLNALVSEGKANILAKPNVLTLDGQEAVINIGGEVPIPRSATTDSTVTNSIDYRDVGIILRYTPRVNADASITAQVYTEVSTPVYVAELKAYRFTKRSAKTNVRLKDGETMVIGGLISTEETRSYTKVPFLGDIPILGKLFSSTKNGKMENELMIFLTANIVK